MRKVLLLALAVTVTIGLGTAYAAIQGTPHDIPDYSGGVTVGTGACSFCHVPHGAQGAKLFPSVIDTSGFTIPWVDGVSMMCYDCHVAGSATYPDAENVNPFGISAHGDDISYLSTNGDLSGAEASNLLNVVYGADATNITCASCHNPHDNANRPFMRTNTGTADPFSAGNALTLAEGALGTLCDDCHIRRFYTGTRNNHPLRTDWTSANGRAAITAMASIPARYQVDMSDLSVTSSRPGGTDNNEDWNLGGKAQWSGATENDYFDCASCHAVHSNESADFDELSADNDTAVPTFISLPGNDLLVQSATPTVATGADAQICLDCHNVTPTLGPGSAGASHPWATTFATGFVTVPGNGEKALGGNALVCQDCHDMHFSRLVAADTPADARTYTLLRNQCNDCHTTVNAQTNHHPIGTVTPGTHTETSPVVSSDVEWDTADVDADTVTKIDTTVDYYFGATGTEMTCNTCHSGGSAYAHNNTGNFPGLVGNITESEMCVDCHGVNPSDNSVSEGTGAATPMGSHFVGAMASTVYWWQDDSVTPAADTPGTQSLPVMSADGNTGSIVCESCHTLKLDGKNSHQITYQTSDNTTAGNAEGPSSADLPAAMLLVDSGNARTDAAPAEGYLCSACHSNTPGGGTTHPVVHQTGGMSAASGTVQTGAGLTNGASLTAGNTVNCESCHRPHDADTDAGTLILEDAGVLGAAINETILCALCHTDKY